jgi:hypothetical protein
VEAQPSTLMGYFFNGDGMDNHFITIFLRRPSGSGLHKLPLSIPCSPHLFLKMCKSLSG